MKKTLIIFGIILLAVYVVLSVIDTSDYGLEKRLWRVQKQFNKIALDPKAIPDQKFEEVSDQYRKLIKKYPDSTHTPKMYVQIGMTYILKGDNGNAIKAFNDILSLYPEDKELGAVALINIGNIYESEEDEEKAIDVYEKIIEEYTLTNVGMNTPLYVANYYLKLDKKDASKAAVKRAVALYQTISEENPQSPLEFNSLRLLVTAYYAQNEWRAAVNTLGKILLDYSKSGFLNPQRAMLIVKSINTVSVTKVKDYELPRGIYRKFIEKNPQHPFNKVMEGMLIALDKLEEKGVVLDTKKP